MYSSMNFDRHIFLCNCHHNQDAHFYHPKRFPNAPLQSAPLYFWLLVTIICFLLLSISGVFFFPFIEFHVSGIVVYIHLHPAFRMCLRAASLLLHIAVSYLLPLLFSVPLVNMLQFIYLFYCWWEPSCFQFGAIKNSAVGCLGGSVS